MAISASMIKELRARSGAGMLDCKTTLLETDGDIDAALESLRKKGVALAAKKASRIAAEGVIVAAHNDNDSVLLEINCETDFVAKDASFTAYANAVAAAILRDLPSDLDAAAELVLEDGNTLEAGRQNLVAKIGENIHLRRFAVLHAAGAADSVSVYLHATRIGVMVKLRGGDASLGRDIAMHIAASSPLCLSEQDMPAQTRASEHEIFTAQAEQSGKPADIVKRMVAGRMKKFIGENTLLGQPFVKDPQQSVGQLVAAAGASVAQMVRFEVGEGLEKRNDDFVAEVMAQAHGASTTKPKPKAKQTTRARS